ncbi:MAG: hypothetical protein MJY62_00805 [Bacteroidales bacterium]|nr:hypothetical protein [Bacteroidales bacterium]
MKKFNIIIISLLSIGCLAASCSKVYQEKWDSLYYIDEFGDKICRLQSTYQLTNDSTDENYDIPFQLPIAIYYSGTWKAEILGECNWAFLDRTSCTGVHYLHLAYLQNFTGETRYTTIKITCDNGESAEITLTQESL